MATNSVSAVAAGFDTAQLSKDFPALNQLVHGKPLVYLDNAATSQKPRSVIDAIIRFYEEDCSNIHRGVHLLSERATKAYEEVRLAVQQFIHAASPAEVIFVRGATEAINLVARCSVRLITPAAPQSNWRRARRTVVPPHAIMLSARLCRVRGLAMAD